MSDVPYYILSGVLSLGVLLGIAMMSRVERAAGGNRLSAVCMALAVLVTLVRYDLLTDAGLWIAMAVGLALGLLGARRVKMIQMPQAVALLNGLGGAASAIVGALEVLHPSVVSIFSTATAGLAVVVGMLTLAGSLIAAAKLEGILSQRPVICRGHAAITAGAIGASAAGVVLLTLNVSTGLMLALCLVASALFGIMLAMRVGGADMPITISLLNSFSGVAAGIAGLALASPLLVAIGGIVGASGLLLTQIMCRAMNRSLNDILLGKTSVSASGPHTGAEKHGGAAAQNTEGPSAETPDPSSADTTDKAHRPKADPVALLGEAKRVIIVPGYGMALAQAQGLVKALADKLAAGGAEVMYAIHPVAGRMPGHMNVLLAEVDVSYEQLFEMDDINPQFATCDVCIVVGANDVVNPAANTAEGTPIYGMPVLNVEQSRHLILLNYDTKPGYAGVENPLYTKSSGVSLMLGDAKETLAALLQKL